MNDNRSQQGLDGFQKSLGPCALDESSLSIRRFKFQHVVILMRPFSVK